jgi:hypothetical protein
MVSCLWRRCGAETQGVRRFGFLIILVNRDPDRQRYAVWGGDDAAGIVSRTAAVSRGQVAVKDNTKRRR